MALRTNFAELMREAGLTATDLVDRCDVHPITAHKWMKDEVRQVDLDRLGDVVNTLGLDGDRIIVAEPNGSSDGA